MRTLIAALPLEGPCRTSKASTRIHKDANTLWREIGSFQGVGAWHPWLKSVVGRGEQPGAIRRAETLDGRKQVERLEEFDSRSHSYCYAMISTPMPVEDYTGEFKIRDENDGTSTVVWWNDFRVVSGEESAVAGNIRQFLNAGLENLKKMYS